MQAYAALEVKYRDTLQVIAIIFSEMVTFRLKQAESDRRRIQTLEAAHETIFEAIRKQKKALKSIQ